MQPHDSEEGAMTLSQLGQSGGSVILAIPQAIVSQLGIEVGQKINLKVKDGVLIVERYQLSRANPDRGTGVTTALVPFADEWSRLSAKFESSRKGAAAKEDPKPAVITTDMLAHSDDVPEAFESVVDRGDVLADVPKIFFEVGRNVIKATR